MTDPRPPSPVPRLAGAALVVMAGFLLSRVLGMIRNIVILNQFGTSREYEAYVAALQVPDFVFQVLVGGAAAAAFIPVFKDYFAHNRAEEAWYMASSVTNLAMLTTAVLAAGLFLAALPLAELLVPGWDEPSQELTAGLIRAMLISPVMFAASGFAASILNSFNLFALAALAPVTYNLSIIAGALLLYEPLGVYGLAAGVSAGALLHLVVQVPGLVRVRMRYRASLDLSHQGVKEVLRLMLPRAVGLGATQLNLMANVLLASFLVAGSVGYLNVAWMMAMAPLAIAMSVSTAVFPTLAEETSLQRTEAVRQLFLASLRTILFLIIPASVGLIVMAEPIIRLVFERGEFTSQSTEGTAYALSFYALGLTGHAMVEIAARMFYAQHDTRTPVLVAVGAVGLSIGLSLVLMRTPLNYGGLALASSLAALAEAGLLVRLLAGRVTGLEVERLAPSALRMLAAGGLMGVGLLWASRELALPADSSLAAQTGLVALLIGGGALLYMSLSAAMRSEEVGALLGLLRAGRRAP